MQKKKELVKWRDVANLMETSVNQESSKVHMTLQGNLDLEAPQGIIV